MTMNIHFSQPLWLAVGAFICLLFLFFIRFAGRRRRARLARFASQQRIQQLTADISLPRRRLKTTLLGLALTGLLLALAGPQYGEQWLEVRQRGIDILIALDCSRSMLAPDIRPNRLQRAKLAVKDFVTELDGDRIGLLPFAGSSFLMCPLTTDYDAFLTSLDAVTPGSIPVGGTNISGVITRAAKILAGETNHKILILVTDGENLQGQAIIAAKKAAEEKMTIYTVGVGTRAGELIPDTQNRGEFIKNKAGHFVRSRLDEKTLQRIAHITGGIYTPLGTMGQGFSTIYQDKLKRIPKQAHQEKRQRRPIERFYWPLAVAIILLMIEFLVSERKSGRFPGFLPGKGDRRRLFNNRKSLIVLLVLAFHPANANGSTAENLFHAGKLDQAEKAYADILKKQPHNPVLLFNMGDVQYRKKQYDKALESFTGALATDDLDLQAKSYFNLGNTRYQLGQKVEKTDPQQAIKHFNRAIKAYENSLKLHPADPEARENLALVKKLVNELKKQQKKREQKQKNNRKNQQNKKKEGKKKNKNSTTDKKAGATNKSGGDNKGNRPEKENGQQKNSPASGKKSGSSDQQKNSGGKNQAKDKTGKTGDKGKAKPQGNTAGQPANGQTTGEHAMTMSRRDQQRRQQGKMTRGEAVNLLDALKNEEGRLEFVPGKTGSSEQSVDRNW